jgi:signal peptidase II
VRKTAVQIFGAAALLVVIDQAIKFWVVTELKGQPAIELIAPLTESSTTSVLRLVFVSNSGAAFGLGSNFTLIISLIALAVVIGLIRWSFKVSDLVWAVAITLLLGGALGNLIDRIFREPAPLRGHVVDFISVGKFPVFNFADICITFAAVVLFIATLTKRDPETIK